jgi:hypothetical protein
MKSVLERVSVLGRASVATSEEEWVEKWVMDLVCEWAARSVMARASWSAEGWVHVRELAMSKWVLSRASASELWLAEL